MCIFFVLIIKHKSRINSFKVLIFNLKHINNHMYKEFFLYAVKKSFWYMNALEVWYHMI